LPSLPSEPYLATGSDRLSGVVSRPLSGSIVGRVDTSRRTYLDTAGEIARWSVDNSADPVRVILSGVHT
jgi:hypothetical protein